MKIIKYIILATLLAFLTACGTGEGGGTSTQATKLNNGDTVSTQTTYDPEKLAWDNSNWDEADWQ